MKAGIITFSYACNYGATLQCLALYRMLRKLGVEADVIRYVPEGFHPVPPLWRGWGIKKGKVLQNIPKKWIAARHGPAMKRAFDTFREQHLTFSPACTLPEEISDAVSEYDALITGSDQVWHFNQKPAFFLEWGAPYSGKRISYAPCCGHPDQPQERLGQIKEWISRFDSISVRNDFSKKLIEGLTGRSVPVVADPTLLVDLNNVQKKVELPYSDYILTYTLGKEISGGHKKAIQAIRKKVGDIPVVAVIPSAHQPHRAPWADHVIYDAGPAEWVYLINHAAFVYTDSFHGVLFALKGQRPFLAYYAEAGRSPRLIDLSERYGLGSRIVSNAAEASTALTSSWDVAATYRCIDEHVALSREFLQSALKL